MRSLLDIRHLELLVAISETSSVAEAADRIGVTASALSHRIREAERRLGIVLFTKFGRSLRHTPAAEILTDGARRIIYELAQIEKVATSSGSGISHVVRLTVGTYACFHWLPAFLEFVNRRHPDIEIDIAANAMLRPYESLNEGTVDIAITPDQMLPGGFAAMELFADELVAIFPPSHRLARRPSIEADELMEETLLTYSFVRVPGFEGERFWSPAFAYPQREVRVESIEAIVELVKAGVGISILSRWALKSHIQSGSIAVARLGETGLDITWRAFCRNRPDDGEATGLVMSALGEWFGNNGA